MRIDYSRDSLKFLDRQTKQTVGRIRAAISGLTLSPPQGDIAPMKGYTDKRKRLRVGSWRVIFRFTKENQIEVLLIIDIDNRGDIYK
ncbi:MAG: type II toxin-antitoxin system RelE/ParE family toxin [Clostridiales bacterium]|jgi:mRNA interferase RelE/StbE|nr:type II toxin-antitoxin system RelE/ParE family toxin [Clostridiales bacterium]